MVSDDETQPKVLRDVEFLYVNFSPGPDGVQASTVVRDRADGKVYEFPGGPVTVTTGRAHEMDPIQPRRAYGLPRGPAVELVPPEHRACRERSDDEQAAIDAVAPTTGGHLPQPLGVSSLLKAILQPPAGDGPPYTHTLSAADVLADPADGEECEECGEDLSGGTSHYHCPVCREVCSVMGHLHTVTARDLLIDPTDGED